MLGSRRGRPSLIGRAAQTAARTALITATATTIAGRTGNRQAGAAAPAPADPAAPAAPAAAGLTDDAMTRLRQLAELQAAGILTEAEFNEQKSRILG